MRRLSAGRRVVPDSRGGRPGQSAGVDYIYNEHFHRVAVVRAGNGLSADGHEFLIHALEHRAHPGLQDHHRRPHRHRRAGQPDRDRRHRAGDQHPDRQSLVPVEQCRSRPLQPQRAAAADIGEHAMGLVPRQCGPPGPGRQPADRRPEHPDGVQGEPAHRQDHLAASRQGTAASGSRPPAARCSTAPGRSSPGSTTPSRSGATRSPSSTTTPRAPRCCPTAVRSRSG